MSFPVVETFSLSKLRVPEVDVILLLFPSMVIELPLVMVPLDLIFPSTDSFSDGDEVLIPIFVPLS